ncbi:MAG: alpha/beta hydrolase [Ilumatobacteraceae bacterium]
MTPTRTAFSGRDGLQLAADVTGDPTDPPVLLFHGGGQTRHSWGTTMRDLAGRGWYVASVDMRGHGDSEWAPDGDYRIDTFADDVISVGRQFDHPVLVGASLGGSSSLVATYRAVEGGGEQVARGLVLVYVAPHIEQAGAQRIGDFMRQHVEDGFATLDDVADAIQTYNPHRPRPTNLEGLKKNVRLHDDGRWYWHWDPAFVLGRMGSDDETRATAQAQDRRGVLETAARALTIPTLLVRGRQSDLLSEEGAAKFRELVPHAEFADVAGAGHMVAGDRNDAFNDAIVSFLERTRDTW